MKILILNWRDIKNPKSGGAEILTHEMAKRWVKWGHSVTQFSSEFEGCQKNEEIDGVNIIREGHPDARFLFSSVHWLAFRNYRKKFQGKFDVILDEVHGLPFFTPFYVKEKKVVLICEVAGKLWREIFGALFGSLGRSVEIFFLRFLYKNILFMTISNSSKEELLENGVKEKNITVLPMGVSFPNNIKDHIKEKNPTLIFLGRLSKPKGVEDAIYALRVLSNEISDVKLWIVGRGEDEYVNYLKKLADELDVKDRIRWFGFVNEEEKFELLAKANVLLVPSIKEGWGLIVPEAAFVGTPSVVYNSPGLRDVLSGSIFKTIVKSNTPEDLAKAILKIMGDKNLAAKLGKESFRVEDFSWDKTARLALEVLKK